MIKNARKMMKNEGLNRNIGMKGEEIARISLLYGI